MRLSKEPDTTSGGGGGGGGGRDTTSRSSGDDEYGMVTGEGATKTRTFKCHVYRDSSMSDVVMTMDLTCADDDDALVRNGGCLVLRD
jgi:hypothetical protein